MTFSDTAMMELGITQSTNIHNTRSLIRTLKYVLDILQTEEAFTVEEYKHTHTHIIPNFLNFNIYVNSFSQASLLALPIFELQSKWIIFLFFLHFFLEKGLKLFNSIYKYHYFYKQIDPSSNEFHRTLRQRITTI